MQSVQTSGLERDEQPNKSAAYAAALLHLRTTTGFMSRVHSLVPSNTLRDAYLYCPASLCFIPCPSPLNSALSIRQSLLARWLRIQCFSSLPLTLPTQCSLLPWNGAKSSKTSCSVRQDLVEACRLVVLSLHVVVSQSRSLHNHCRLSSYLWHYTRDG